MKAKEAPKEGLDQKITGAYNQVKDTISAAYEENLADRVEHAKVKIADTYDDVKEKVSDGIDNVKEKINTMQE